MTVFVNESDTGKRLDVVAASVISDCSRSYAAKLIVEGRIQVQGENKKPGYRVKAGEIVEIRVPAPIPATFAPESIEIDILYEDEHLIVINKRAGMVVHPAPGHFSGTLVNALLNHCPDIGTISGEIRPGIVHRLDKDTSGTLVVAKSSPIHENLSLQFKSRTIKKEYLVLVHGEMKSGSGSIHLPIGRHPVHRKRMSTKSNKGREAETLWEVRERFKNATFIKVNLKTGRTHQIRVHFAAINHPVIGDPVYGMRKMRSGLLNVGFKKKVTRQMLHAWRLKIFHPALQKKMTFESPIPQDMEECIKALGYEGPISHFNAL
ncbi:MAG: RluA family pseudouridine synthase [Thermodesulfobacteriota bacterium]|nr:RluA family pseudouridine synthase [Thermodesulfobacteriota bacterium]